MVMRYMKIFDLSYREYGVSMQEKVDFFVGALQQSLILDQKTLHREEYRVGKYPSLPSYEVLMQYMSDTVCPSSLPWIWVW